MFNRKAAASESKPDQVLAALALRPGQNIADIGAGGGYFTLKFADMVGKKGRVYAIDTNPEFLEFIKNSAMEKGLRNVETIPVVEGKLILPIRSLDLVFLRNVYHHLPNRVEYSRNLKKFLKPGGKIVIIEYKRGGLFRRIFGHYVPKETILKEMEEAGYKLKEDFGFLLKQSFMIFSPKKLSS